MNQTITDLKRATAVFQLSTADTLGLLSVGKVKEAFKMYCVIKNYNSPMHYHAFARAMRKYAHVPREYDDLQRYKATLVTPRRQGKSIAQALSNLCQEITLEKQMNKPQKCYIVINITGISTPPPWKNYSSAIPSGKRPTVLHVDRNVAEAEAERLAKQNPEQIFMVFETTSAFVTDKPVVRHAY